MLVLGLAGGFGVFAELASRASMCASNLEHAFPDVGLSTITRGRLDSRTKVSFIIEW